MFTSTVLVLGFAFWAGMYSATSRNGAFVAYQEGVEEIRRALVALDETTVFVPSHFLQPAVHDGDGVTVNRGEQDGAVILMSGFFEGDNQLRLLRRDGTVIARWPARFSEIFPESDHVPSNPATDWNVDTHGALALPDGSVVFNFEDLGLVKLDRCGRVAWTLAHRTHHSVARAEGGGFWVPGQRWVAARPSPFPPFAPPYDEDLILRISDDGRIVREISVPELMYENGLEPVLTASGRNFQGETEPDRELVHLNKVAELSSDLADAFPDFEAGDLLLSLRNLNLIMVVDPDTRRVKWHQTGPWLRQHDPQFNRDGTISVFNNNAYQTALKSGERVDPEAPRVSNVISVDPATGRSEVAYGGRPGQEFLSVIRGKHEPTPAGGFLITEFEAGRVFEVDADGRTVWEYVNRYDADRVAEVTGARLYPEGYFTVEDWSCPGA